MLKTLSGEENRNWRGALSKLAFAYNSTTHKSTGFSPFYLMFGRESRLPIDTIFKIEVEGTKFSEKSWSRFVDEWKSTMKQAYEIANNNMEKIAGYNKKYFDAHHQMAKPVLLQPGDKVLIKNVRDKGGTGKLKSYWEEQIFVVEEKKKDFPVYTVRNVKKNHDIRVLHRNLLLNCNDLPVNVFDDEKEEKKSVVNKQSKGKERVQDNLQSQDEDGERSDEEPDVVAIYHEELDCGDGGNQVSGDEASSEGLGETDGEEGSECGETVPDHEHRYPRRNRKPPTVMTYDEDFKQTVVHR